MGGPMNTKITLYLFCMIAVAAAVPLQAQAQLTNVYEGGVVSVPVSYDRKAGVYGEGLDLHAIAGFLNVGYSFRHWDSDIIGWNDRKIRNEISFYAGVGLANLLQAQAGISRAGFRMRLRSDIILFSDGSPGFSAAPGKWGYFKKGIALTPFIETDFHKSIYGLGIGLTY